jgi:hypothetical protein
MSGPIKNAANIPFNVRQGSVPDMSDALLDWFQTMNFGIVTKKTSVGKVTETVVETKFQGSAPTPHKPTSLQIRMQGERKWKWFMVFAETQLKLNLDDTIIYKGQQYRVMDLNDYRIYGFMQYFLIQDYTNTSPYNLLYDNEEKIVFDGKGEAMTS